MSRVFLFCFREVWFVIRKNILKKLYLGLVIFFIPSIPKPEEVLRKL